MIYFLTGDNPEKSRAKAHEIIDSLLRKKPDASLFKIDADHFAQDQMEQFIGGIGLFENNYIVFLDGVFENEEVEDFILKRLEDIQESKNIFIILESKLTKAIEGKIEKVGGKIQEFEERKVPKKEFNMFAMTDALSSRDKKRLWVLYTKAVALEKAPEEIHGLLFWQMKSLLQASRSKNAIEAGQKPFVFSKSKQGAGNFKEGELEEKTGELISIYHDARRWIGEFEVMLERWVLGL